MSRVVPGIHVLTRTLGSNIYVIEGDGPVVVDAGFPVDGILLRRLLARESLGEPSILVATHYHLDHVGPFASLKARFDGCRAAAHRADSPVMEGSEPYDIFRIKGPKSLYYRMMAPVMFRYRFFDVEEKLEEGDVLPVMGGLEVIHLPGHTRGSIALYQRERGILFSGDTIRNEGGVLEGPPPQFSPWIDEAFAGIRRKILPLDFDILLPGHGRPVLSGGRDGVEEMMKESGRYR